MKGNKIPATERLQQRIDNLEIKLGNYSRRIGRGNPYSQCKHCGISQPALSYSPHYKGCPVPGWAKEILHYSKLLMDLQTPIGPVDIKAQDSVLETKYSSAFHYSGVAHLLPISKGK